MEPSVDSSPTLTASDSDGILVEIVGDGEADAVLHLADGADYDTYVWTATSEDGTLTTVTSEPHVHIDCVGDIDITVEASGGTCPSAVYTGSAEIPGTVVRDFEWSYDGMSFRAGIEFEFDTYSAYVHSDTVRNGTDFVSLGSMDAATATIALLESSLREAYVSAYGADAPADGQGYADFLLGFVQSAVHYSSDRDLYGIDDYWAYPEETVYHGCGDCEDKSLLCAALLDAAGYESGILIVPGHAMAVVSIDGYESKTLTYTQALEWRVLTIDHDGTAYRVCETTVDTPGVGYSSRDYGTDSEGNILYRGCACGGFYGIY